MDVLLLTLALGMICAAQDEEDIDLGRNMWALGEVTV